MNLDRLWLRLTGLLVLLSCLALLDPGSASVFHRLVIPLIMAAGTWALIQNAAAVALGATVLGAIHSELAATHWIDRLAYPALTLTGSAVLAVITFRRFRHRISRTHEARWADRRTS